MSASVTATFVFADIAGFTALTEAHGDEEAVALVREFCRAVADELPAPRSAPGCITAPPSSRTGTTSAPP